MKSLKQMNIKWISINIIANILLFVWVVFGKIVYSNTIKDYIISKDTLLTVCFPLLTIILNGLLPSSFKAILVFTRINNPLPGTRVFSKLMKKDNRIDISVIEKKHGGIPVSPNEQNALWYKLFKIYEKDPSVYDSHRLFLLTRDITSICALFFVFFSLGSIFVVGLKKSVFYICFLLFQYLITMISARNYGNRFVLNVLALDSATE